MRICLLQQQTEFLQLEKLVQCSTPVQPSIFVIVQRSRPCSGRSALTWVCTLRLAVLMASGLCRCTPGTTQALILSLTSLEPSQPTRLLDAICVMPVPTLGRFALCLLHVYCSRACCKLRPAEPAGTALIDVTSLIFCNNAAALACV